MIRNDDHFQWPMRTPLGALLLGGLMLLAFVGGRPLRAADVAADGQAPPADKDAADAPGQPSSSTNDADAVPDISATEPVFELRVVGPDRKPVPAATVEIRTNPVPTAEQIKVGKFVRKANYGASTTTDAEGRLVVAFPKRPNNLHVNVQTPGYGPYWAAWSSENHSQAMPARFTAELDAGWSAACIVVDDEGKPVEGVKIGPSIEYKKRPGDESQLGVGTNLKTDAAGTWRFDCVPASMSEVQVAINHPQFKAIRRPLSRSEFGIALDEQPRTKIVLDRGLSIVGRVTDEEGRPIGGALVRAKFQNELRDGRSADDGTYRLVGCEPRMAKIVISAKGRATDMREVRVDDDMEPVDFQMKPGGHVRIRVLDENSNPVPKARIFYQRWRGQRFEYFEFDHKNQYADKDGVWEWNEAPLDAFEADICRPDGMQLARQRLVPREEEYVFRPPPALVVSGKVIDAETKEPLKSFHVVPGIRSENAHPTWLRNDRFTATDGVYRLRRVHDYPGHLVRIEASGYQSAVSRDIKSDEGAISIDFELVKGKDVAATVLTPDGQPATRARVALGIPGSQIHVQNGQISDSQTYSARQETDDKGRFRFPPQEEEFALVITHPDGYAHLVATPQSMPEKIELEKWARVEGTFRVGKNTVANVPITINTSGFHSYGDGAPSIFASYETTTGKEGQFAFERVIPGDARIGRRVMLSVEQGAADVTSAGMMPTSFPPGETTRIELGGTGRAVVGRLEAPEGVDEKVRWNFATVNVQRHVFTPPRPEDPPIPAEIKQDVAKRAAWLAQWQQQTKEGQAWMAWRFTVEENQRISNASPYFTATVDREGRFRIDDVPEGDWSVSARFDLEGKMHLPHHRFTMPAIAEGAAEDPLDLGVLGLQ
ncbi:MAG: carboxypeptidase regulatory-like domain-containing protein [Planctomycetia bacterium]|nr:carboxypeptidase regulatory-like domain-containing protein [Planctomycetia bacterium]